MNIEAKCHIIATAWTMYSQMDDDGWNELIATYDLAFPFAFGFEHGLISINDSGIPLIEECWEAMCATMRIDPDGFYSDYSEWIDASPNDPL